MSETGQSNTWKLVYIISFPVGFSGILGESQLSEVASNLSFHTSVPVSLLPKNEKYLETSRHVLQRKSAMVMKYDLCAPFIF